MKLRGRKTKPNVPDILEKVMMRLLSLARIFVVEFKTLFFKLKAFFEGGAKCNQEVVDSKKTRYFSKFPGEKKFFFAFFETK